VNAAVAAVIPPQPDGAARSWRKLVTAVQPGADSTFGLDGPFLTPDLAYELPEGAAVIACDVYEQRRVIVLYRVGGALEVVKAWEMKGPLGKRACDFPSCQNADSTGPSTCPPAASRAPTAERSNSAALSLLPVVVDTRRYSGIRPAYGTLPAFRRWLHSPVTAAW
jgi:hypothetical protein